MNFYRFSSGSGFSSFNFAGLVPIKIKNTVGASIKEASYTKIISRSSLVLRQGVW